MSADAYDYVIVGAGGAGCVLAARLTEDPGTSVLLIEAGGSDRNPIIVMPGAIPFAYQSKRINWGIQSGPEPELHGRTIDEKAGRVIGGSGSINAMIVNRGNPMDYQGWAAGGLAEWDWAHVLPYFRKMETFVDGPDAWRGGSGPLKIRRARAALRAERGVSPAQGDVQHPAAAGRAGEHREQGRVRPAVL